VLDDVLDYTLARGNRVYLTGHSMGGHGTWHLAANDPDRFLAIAPSAGWCSFDSYVGRPGGKLTRLWQDADGASLTQNLIGNLAGIPTFILHGDKDDNVPLREAMQMEAMLVAAGGAPRVHHQPGAKHWWNGKAAKGTDCVDWPGIFELFEQTRVKPEPAHIAFRSVDPAVDADHHWIRVDQPLRYGESLHVHARSRDDVIEIRTGNVRRFRARPPSHTANYVIDGQALQASWGSWFLRTQDGWTVAAPTAGEKSPRRCGPFKRAFDNRFVLVYSDRDRESFERARYDAQAWWYRGNGDAPLISDTQFVQGDYAGRNVILYGNESTNRAWKVVFGDGCPITVRPGHLRVGNSTWIGSDLGCMFVYPRADDDTALAAAFAHTGAAGARSGYALLPFVSGVGYPDYVGFSSRFLEVGDEAVLTAGWFDHRWKLPQAPRR